MSTDHSNPSDHPNDPLRPGHVPFEAPPRPKTDAPGQDAGSDQPDRSAMTIEGVIREEHARLRRGFEELAAVLDSDLEVRRRLWSELKRDLLAHHEAEEETLFAALVQLGPESRHESLHAVSEHGEHKKVLEQMQDLAIDDPAWHEKLAELRHDVEHHLEEEETDVLPLASDRLSREESASLVRRYQQTRD